MTILLLIQPMNIGSVVLDVNSLVYFSSGGFIGLQFMFFYFFARFYAEVNELLPKGRVYKFFNKSFTLEKGILTGVIMLIGGIVLTIYALIGWKNVSFGDLSPRDSMRIVVPAVFLLISGFQIIQSSFLLSIMELKRKRSQL